MLRDIVLNEHFRIVKYHILTGPTCSHALLLLIPRGFFSLLLGGQGGVQWHTVKGLYGSKSL